MGFCHHYFFYPYCAPEGTANIPNFPQSFTSDSDVGRNCVEAWVWTRLCLVRFIFAGFACHNNQEKQAKPAKTAAA
jgi:hypothetical protein